jgi:hypothetical protein
MTNDELRARIAELTAEIIVDEDGRPLNPSAYRRAEINRCVDTLMERGAACLLCAFGAWPKTSECKHD